MNSIEILKEIGLNEVSRKTHIDSKYLEHIINKDFANLKRLNAKGFTKILQREYNIDFSTWIEEYNTFLGEHANENTQNRVLVEPTISAYKSTSKNSHGFLITIIFLAIIALGAWFFELHKYLDELPKIFSDKNQSINYSNTTTVQTAQQNLVILKEENESVALPQQDTNLSILSINDVPALGPNDTNLTQEVQEQNMTVAKNDEFDIENLKEIKIIPTRRVWVGIVDLEADKKRSLNSDLAIPIELNKKQLIVTGHGEITLQIGNESKKFNTDSPVRFLVQDGKLKIINIDEFSALNKGKTW